MIEDSHQDAFPESPHLGRDLDRTSTIELPLPPSANALWRSNRGRVHKSKPCTDWRRTAGWELACKSLLDLLVAHQVIVDDAQVMVATARWDTAIPPGRIFISVESAFVAAEV